MNDFINRQQELARATVLDLWPNDDEITQTVMREVDTLIQQTITNTGAELMRKLIEMPGTPLPDSYSESPDIVNKNEIKQHIIKVTGWNSNISIKEYDLLPNGTEKCRVCKSKQDVTYDEDGEPICTDCLFYNESMKEMDDEDRDLLGY